MFNKPRSRCPFLFSLVWPTVRCKRSRKTHSYKNSRQTCNFLKKTAFYCICLDGWKRGIQTICFFIIRVDWVLVTECTYTLFEVMSENEYWKEINDNNMQFSYRSPTETVPILNYRVPQIYWHKRRLIWSALYYQQEGERNLIFSLWNLKRNN